jgi:hypothetical protein
VYDARSPAFTGGFSAAVPVYDQKGCFTCVTFAVLAAAEAAVGSSLRMDARNRPALSRQYFHFCSGDGGEVRS